MNSPMFACDKEIDEFVERFRARTLPKSEWTHQAHLIVGLWHLQRHPFDEALSLLRSGISAYNEATGVANTDDGGYHETLTVFFLRALAAHAEGRVAGGSRVDLFNGLAGSRLRDKLLPLAFYRRDRIMSPAARHDWIEPDLQPLENLRSLLNSQVSNASFYLRPAGRPDAESFVRLVIALAEFEKLEPPDAAAQARLIEDAFGAEPRIEAWLAFADGHPEPVGYAILLETYSSFLARPTLYIEDIFVLEAFRKCGIGSAMLRKTVELAEVRGCGRIEWTALDWNTNAQRVYEEKLGARRMSEWFLYRMTRKEMRAYLRGAVVDEGTLRSPNST
jgi:GNAT superfamily N-acetyltransferase